MTLRKKNASEKSKIAAGFKYNEGSLTEIYTKDARRLLKGVQASCLGVHPTCNKSIHEKEHEKHLFI